MGYSDRLLVALLGLFLLAGQSGISAEEPESPLKIFGYFQNSLIHQSGFSNELDDEPEQNSFSVQQHNLFFRRELSPKWRAFVNFEYLNSFSSSRQWGSANLEELWVRYRDDERFSLKLGLQIPIFNNLNEIKNRTPLLPYIIRPLVYETSFSEFIAVEEYLPARAFVQAYGFLPIREAKLEYALFLGNSPNISSDMAAGQTGIDTTDTFLVGGRLGVRLEGLKAGLSATRDHVNGTAPFELEEGKPLVFEEITRRRLGVDLSYDIGDLFLEAEIIGVSYDDDTPGFSVDKDFYYATLGYRVTERLLAYASYWLTSENLTEELPILDPPAVVSGTRDIVVPTVGFAYSATDRIVLKGQFAAVDIEIDIPSLPLSADATFNHYSTAVSVFF